jgi:hypothetical protein
LTAVPAVAITTAPITIATTVATATTVTTHNPLSLLHCTIVATPVSFHHFCGKDVCPMRNLLLFCVSLGHAVRKGARERSRNPDKSIRKNFSTNAAVDDSRAQKFPIQMNFPFQKKNEKV